MTDTPHVLPDLLRDAKDGFIDYLAALFLWQIANFSIWLGKADDLFLPTMIAGVLFYAMAVGSFLWGSAVLANGVRKLFGKGAGE